MSRKAQNAFHVRTAWMAVADWSAAKLKPEHALLAFNEFWVGWRARILLLQERRHLVCPPRLFKTVNIPALH